MTISSDTRQTGLFAGPISSYTNVDFEFRLHDETMLEVVVVTDGEEVIADGSTYTVALSPDQYGSPGGAVTIMFEVPEGSSLRIRSNLSLQQQSDLTLTPTYNPRTVEDAIDYLTMCIQDVARKAGV